ncbi:hypothetical protein BXT84_00645 [Sulfobacillus thermotolerans]|uniref:Uncharacterized protein n=1 Tax=Sulfobacillus thermotolerans TaxID=338644 RepID=A0ABM6RMQ0_9FIRM|nr:hypothetical protein BXT84_00645 [Sulfobacillus thermotolerans]
MEKEIRINVEDAQKALNAMWLQIEQAELGTDIEPSLASEIATLLRSNTKSYRYVLPTQLLAKVVNSNANAICLQKKSNVVGRFDARSLCHKVIVPFERSHGTPLGGSPEPYVNNPLRVPEVSSEHRMAQKDKDGWDQLCLVLNRIQECDNDQFSQRTLKQVLLEIRRIQQEQLIIYSVPQRSSLQHTLRMVDEFLKPRTGGSRLQAVCVALLRTIGQLWGIYDQVLSEVVNASDASSNRPADIDCRKEGRSILAVEVKDRTVTLQLLEDKITTTRVAHIKELLFLIRSEPIVENNAVIERAQREFLSGQNIYLIHVDIFIQQVLTLVGEDGRLLFLGEIGKALEEFRLDFKDRNDYANILVRIFD